MRWAVLILATPLIADDRADQLLKRVAERYATLARYDIEYERTDAGDLATGLPGSSGRIPTVSRYRIAASTGNRIRTEPRASKLFWISTGDGVIRLNRREEAYILEGPSSKQQALVEGPHNVLNRFVHVDESASGSWLGEERIKVQDRRTAGVRIRIETDTARRDFWIDPVSALVWKFESITAIRGHGGTPVWGGSTAFVFERISLEPQDDLFVIPPGYQRVTFFRSNLP